MMPAAPPAMMPMPAGYPPAAAYAPGYYPLAQPPKKKSKVGLVVLLVLVPLIVLFLIIFVQALSEVMRESGNEASPAPTAPASFPGQDGDPVDGPDPVEDEWVNEDYQIPPFNANPPELPWPDTYGEAADWLNANVFYSYASGAPVRCDLNMVDPSTASKEQMSAYTNEIVVCLMRVWGPELEAAGFDASTPKVYVYSGSGQSACGKLSPGNAFYCPADQQIYYALDIADEFPALKHEAVLTVQVIAHEFAHGIQGKTGVLAGQRVWEQYFEEQKDMAAAMASSRSLEMQADCWAGQFYGSVEKYLNLGPDATFALFDLMIELGDDTITGDPNFVGDHGRGHNRQAWFINGISNRPISTCNTFRDDIPAEDLA